jgi:hypothetical protein
MKRTFVTAVTLGAIALAACSDSSLDPTELGGNAQADDREDMLQVLEASGFFADVFGTEGAQPGAPAAAGVFASPMGVEGEVPLPHMWGRHHRRPVRRVITIEVDDLEGIATVTKEVVFEGEFVFDLLADDGFNPVRKAMKHTLIQHARFVRIETDGDPNHPDEPGHDDPKPDEPQPSPQDGDDGRDHGRKWRLAAVSPAQWVMTDAEKQTVHIGRIEIWVNEELCTVIEDPDELFEVDGRVPRLEVGQLVTVKAWVEGGSDGNLPPFYVFLHMFHASPDTRIWMRRQMEAVEGDLGVYYTRSWEVLFPGRERIAVDAIDSQSFVVSDAEDYAANAWGIPYVIQ